MKDVLKKSTNSWCLVGEPVLHTTTTKKFNEWVVGGTQGVRRLAVSSLIAVQGQHKRVFLIIKIGSENICIPFCVYCSREQVTTA